MKKITLLMAAMLLSFQFASVQASLFVKGVDALKANSNDVLSDGGSVKYNSSTQTLTLTSASITTSTSVGIGTDMDLIIELVGNNSISVSGSYYDEFLMGQQGYAGISEWGGSGMTIKGSGTLVVSSEEGLGIFTPKDLTIKDGCKVTVSSSNSTALMANGDIKVDNATLIAKGNNKEVTIVGCTDLIMENGVDIRSNHEYDEGKFYVKGTTTEAKDDITIGLSSPGTGIEQVQNAQCTMQSGKVMKDGQLVIIREGVQFNAIGVKL